MKIKCVENREELFKDRFQTNDSFTSLEIKKEYIVYALTQFYNYTWYCILDGNSLQPMWYPYFLFEIIDPKISRYWIFNFKSNFNKQLVPFLGFPEWAKDDYYYHNLIEGEEKENKIFLKYQKLMDLEFPNPDIHKIAQIGDERWLMCPLCINAWENTDKHSAMVECPKCLTIFHNPRYQD